jgi:hypothetical protein
LPTYVPKTPQSIERNPDQAILIKIQKNETFWVVLCKLMTPLEYMLFTMNMVFFSTYFVEAQIIAELGEFERENALQLMAVIDQLLLFFFTLKFCLTFSQHFTFDIFADEIKNQLKEKEDLMRGVLPTNSKQTMSSYFKGSKMFKKGFKPIIASATPA